MTELSTIMSQPKSTNDITYGYGQSSLGGFLTAIDNEGVCAILLGDDRAELLRDLLAAFPDRKLELGDPSGPCNSITKAVASLIDNRLRLSLTQCRYAAAISSSWSTLR